MGTRVLQLSIFVLAATPRRDVHSARVLKSVLKMLRMRSAHFFASNDGDSPVFLKQTVMRAPWAARDRFFCTGTLLVREQL
jgi:hypothetical protein